MSDLSPKQLVFVQEYLMNKNGRQAAITAGYSEHSADSTASRMLKNDKVKQYLDRKETNLNRDLREMFVDKAAKAFRVIEELMDSAINENVRFSAAKDLLDRAGYKPVDKLVADVKTETITVQLPSELD